MSEKRQTGVEIYSFSGYPEEGIEASLTIDLYCSNCEITTTTTYTASNLFHHNNKFCCSNCDKLYSCKLEVINDKDNKAVLLEQKLYEMRENVIDLLQPESILKTNGNLSDTVVFLKEILEQRRLNPGLEKEATYNKISSRRPINEWSTKLIENILDHFNHKIKNESDQEDN